MCEPTTAAIGLMAVGTGMSAYGQYQQGKAQRRASQATAADLERVAVEEEEAGEIQRQHIRMEGAQALGEGIAGFAARNVDLSSDTPSYWEIGARKEIATDVEAAAIGTERRASSLRRQAGITSVAVDRGHREGRATA